MNADRDYATLVKAIRDARGLTQKELAKQLGVSFATVNGWENGRHEPMPLLAAHIVKMAAAAGVGVSAGRPARAKRKKPAADRGPKEKNR